MKWKALNILYTFIEIPLEYRCTVMKTLPSIYIIKVQPSMQNTYIKGYMIIQVYNLS